MEYLISLILGYVIGSLPTAYLALKRFKNLDITTQGTGNVGAMNSYDVTKSKTIGIVVFIIDFIKGMLPIIILKLFLIYDFSYYTVALLGCVFSHCYNPWLKLKGGRGLASAAGGTALIFPFALVVWGLLWLIFFLMKRDITIDNVAASVMTLLIIISSSKTAIKYTFPKAESEALLVLFAIGLLMIIVSKHTEPIQELLVQSKSSKRIKK